MGKAFPLCLVFVSLVAPLLCVSGDFNQEKIKFMVIVEPRPVNRNIVSNQTYLFNVSITNTGIDPLQENVSATENFTPITGNLTVILKVRVTAEKPRLIDRQNWPDELNYGGFHEQEEEEYRAEFPIMGINETERVVFSVDFPPLVESEDVFHEALLWVYVQMENTVIDNEYTRTTNDLYRDWDQGVGSCSMGYELSTPQNIRWLWKLYRYYEENEGVYERMLAESTYELKESYFGDGFADRIRSMKRFLDVGDYRNARGEYQWIQAGINLLSGADELYPFPVDETSKRGVVMSLDRGEYGRFDDLYLTINNTGDSEIWYEPVYWFEKSVDGAWQEVVWDNPPWKGVEYLIAPREPHSSSTMRLVHPFFSGGTYRVCMRIHCGGDSFVLRTVFRMRYFPLRFLDFAWGDPYWMSAIGVGSAVVLIIVRRLLKTRHVYPV